MLHGVCWNQSRTDFQRYAYGNCDCDTGGATEATSDHTIHPRLEVRHYNACTKVCIWVGAEARLGSTDRQIHSYHVGPIQSPVSLPVNTIYTYYLRETRLLFHSRSRCTVGSELGHSVLHSSASVSPQRNENLEGISTGKWYQLHCGEQQTDDVVTVVMGVWGENDYWKVFCCILWHRRFMWHILQYTPSAALSWGVVNL